MVFALRFNLKNNIQNCAGFLAAIYKVQNTVFCVLIRLNNGFLRKPAVPNRAKITQWLFKAAQLNLDNSLLLAHCCRTLHFRMPRAFII